MFSQPFLSRVSSKPIEQLQNAAHQIIHDVENGISEFTSGYPNNPSQQIDGSLPGGPNGNTGHAVHRPAGIIGNVHNLAASVIGTVVGGTQRVIDTVGDIISHFG